MTGISSFIHLKGVRLNFGFFRRGLQTAGRHSSDGATIREPGLKSQNISALYSKKWPWTHA